MNIFFYNTIIGKLGIQEHEGKITNIYFESDETPESINIKETDIIRNTYNQLYEYFNNERKEFDIPINPKGTDFMKKCWNSLMEITYGETATYKDIAICIGSPNAYRAVGLSNNKNPIPIIIPCHRIIGFNKKLVGYRGGLEVKKLLLSLEGIKLF